MGSQPAPNDSLATDHSRRSVSWWGWLAASLLAYLGFVAMCFYMESEARTRFNVPSEADIAAITDRATRVRTEGARHNALEDMRSWTPYAVYSIGVGVVAFGGTAIATVLGTLVIWRGVRRDSVRKARYIVSGILIVMMMSMAALVWPAIVAAKRFEAKRTSFVLGG